MYEDDEEELELLRQYEDRELNEDEEGYSSDDIDSDLEDKIMSMVQYGSGLIKKKATAPATPVPEARATSPAPSVAISEPMHKPKVIYAPLDTKEKQKTTFSAATELQLQNSNDSSSEEGILHSSDEEEEDKSGDEEEEDKSGDEEYSTPQEDLEVQDEPKDIIAAEPQVTRYINLEDDGKQYMDDDVSEEEAELGLKLQELIEEQIYNRQSKKRFNVSQPIRVCYSCHQPGHERKDCNLCMDCGGPKHRDSRCVGARYCVRCKLRGHNAADCENDRSFRNCLLCNRDYHCEDVCPSLLHKYVNEVPVRTVPQAWCYQCTAKGHYGDECPRLPQYLETLPSVFSKESLSYGSRFDLKKPKKYQKPNNHHQRWPDSSRDNNPRKGHDSDRDYNNGPNKKRTRYEDNNQKFRHENTSRNQKNNNNGGGSKQLDVFFQNGKGNNSRGPPYNTSKSGNSNWKAMNNNTLPQPTRTGTVNVNAPNRRHHQQQQQRQTYEPNFPRSNLPKPTASGVIDLTGNSNGSNSWEEPRRAPKYHGGYNRRR